MAGADAVNGRFSRSTREAFADERFPAIEIYRVSRKPAIIYAVVMFACFAGIGVMLAWRV